MAALEAQVLLTNDTMGLEMRTGGLEQMVAQAVGSGDLQLAAAAVEELEAEGSVETTYRKKGGRMTRTVYLRGTAPTKETERASRLLRLVQDLQRTKDQGGPLGKTERQKLRALGFSQDDKGRWCKSRGQGGYQDDGMTVQLELTAAGFTVTILGPQGSKHEARHQSIAQAFRMVESWNKSLNS